MIEKIAIISFLVYAVHYTMQPGEIFAKLGDFFYNMLPEKIHPPVFECQVCMCPHYGTVLYWLIWANSPKEWIIVVISAMGLNVILNNLFPKREDIKKKL